MGSFLFVSLFGVAQMAPPQVAKDETRHENSVPQMISRTIEKHPFAELLPRDAIAAAEILLQKKGASLADRCEALELKAAAYSRLGDFPVAMVCYQDMLQISPASKGLIKKLVLTCLRSDRCDLASKYLESGKAMISDAEYLWGKGLIVAQNDGAKAALPLFERAEIAIGADGIRADLALSKGTCHGLLGNYREALRAIDQHLSAVPHMEVTVEPFIIKGLCLDKLGDRLEAIRVLAFAAQLSPDDSRPFRKIARIYLSIPDKDTAHCFFRENYRKFPQEVWSVKDYLGSCISCDRIGEAMNVRKGIGREALDDTDISPRQ